MMRRGNSTRSVAGNMGSTRGPGWHDGLSGHRDIVSFVIIGHDFSMFSVKCGYSPAGSAFTGMVRVWGAFRGR